LEGGEKASNGWWSIYGFQADRVPGSLTRRFLKNSSPSSHTIWGRAGSTSEKKEHRGAGNRHVTKCSAKSRHLSFGETFDWKVVTAHEKKDLRRSRKDQLARPGAMHKRSLIRKGTTRKGNATG